MSPQKKLPKSNPEGKGKTERPHCPYCHFHICWRHGFYKRKGFHRHPTAPRDGDIDVPRYLCRSPACEHTFSVLPEEVLPYCRFLLTGLFSIIQDRSDGKSAYWIAKHRWDTTVRVLFRAIDRVEKATCWLKQQIQEYTGRVTEGFREPIRILQKRLAWFRLTRSWSHHFYPLRVGHILNPHNSGSKSP